MKKRLVLLLDGSGVSVASGHFSDQSNVYRLSVALRSSDDDDVPQILFYIPGVGTRGDLGSRITGRGLDHMVREAYVNLAANYELGDEIYIFGYSRGAAAARALTGMLSEIGLLKAHHIDHLSYAWDSFLLDPSDAEQNALKAQIETQHIWPFRWDVTPTIRFLGAFDTVAGTSWDMANIFSRVRFRGLNLDPCVKVGIQILAIDDTRIPSFEPLLWDGASTGCSLCKNSYPSIEGQQAVEQIWLPGVHGDIGGDATYKYLHDVALLTMIERVERYCPELRFNPESIDYIIQLMSSRQGVGISNERYNLGTKLLRRGSRIVKGSPTESIHPVHDLMLKEFIYIRGSMQRYVPNAIYLNDAARKAPRAFTKYDSFIINAFYKNLARVRAKSSGARRYDAS